MKNSIRLFYFLFHVGLGCISSFMPTYLKVEGFSGTEISSIISLGALFGLFGVPLFWGWISDRIQKPQVVLRILAAGTLLGSIPLLFFTSYWFVFGTFCFYSFCSIGIMGILDSLASVYSEENNIDFGRMRLFVPAGWFVGSVGLGYYIDLTGKGWNDVSVIVAFVVSFALMFIAAISLKPSGEIKNQDRATFSEIKQLFKNKYLVIFYIMAMVNMMGVAAYLVYYGPLVEYHGYSPKVVGLGIGVGTLSEVVFMFYFDKIRKWIGVDMIIILTIAISIFRWLVIAFTSNATVLIAIQVLHSEIGLFVLASVSFVTNNVPRKMVTTGQAIFYSMTYGIGQYVGIMLMGYLYDYFGDPTKLFLVSAFIHIIPLTLAIYNYSSLKKHEAIELKQPNNS